MPHNHPPRCCCGQPDHSIRTQPDTCPSCIEHGELAQLADNECPSCHQLPGRSPTDYCQRTDWHTQPGQCPGCGSYRIDGQPPVLHRDGCTAQPAELPDPNTVPYGTEIGTYRAMGDPVRWVQHWATQTTQPATRTTTPPTQHREASFADTCPSCFVSVVTRPRPGCLTPDQHTHVEPTPLATPTPVCPCQTAPPGDMGVTHHPLCQHHPDRQ